MHPFLQVAFLVLSVLAAPKPDAFEAQKPPPPLLWRQTSGPYGGLIHAVGFTPSGEVLVGMETGAVYRSSGDGAGWTRMPFDELNAVAWKTGGLLYVATGSRGVCRSRDDGATWAFGEQGLSVHALALLPSGGILAGSERGLLRSEDGGATWTPLTLPLPARALVAVPSGHILFAATSRGVFRSTDDGGSWSDMSAGLPTRDVLALAGNGSGQVYAATPVGLYRTVDDGVSWSEAIVAGASAPVTFLAIGPSNDVFAGLAGKGLFRSGDDPARWDRIGRGELEQGARALVVDERGRVLAASAGSAFASTDHGASWKEMRLGFRATEIGALGAFPGRILLAASRSAGMYVSLDDGGTWRPSVGAAATVTSLAVDTTPQLLAGTADGRVLFTRDLGVSWESLGAGAWKSTRAIVGHPQGPILVATGEGIFSSSDRGGSFVPASSGLLERDVLDLSIGRGGDVYAATKQGIFRSADVGQSWSRTGFPLLPVSRIAAASDGAVVALSSAGPFRSTDQGTTWEQLPLPKGTYTALAVDSEGFYYVGGDGTGVLRSYDGGATWTKQNEGLADLSVLSISVDTMGRVFAGTKEGGVFRATGTRTPSLKIKR